MFSTADQKQILGTDLYLKKAAIPGFPTLFFIPSGYPESQMLTQAQLTATSSPPSSVPTGKVFGQTLKSGASLLIAYSPVVSCILQTQEDGCAR